MSARWRAVCALEDLLPQSGVCALIEGRQIALFRAGDEVYALDNLDPMSGANVLSRGIVGDLKGDWVVASPVYKHHYRLSTGECTEEPGVAVRTYAARVSEGCVYVRIARGMRAGKRRLVVVGNGMAGMRVVEEVLNAAPAAYEITVFGAEPSGAYNRILLSPVLAGEKQFEEIVSHTPQWYADRAVTLHAGDPIVAIDRARRCVTSRSGRVVDYDRLLIATGSTPIRPVIPGVDLPGVVTFRDIEDVAAMLRAARTGGDAVVIGGGLLGLEAAHGLARQGMRVSVVHNVATLMNRQLDEAAGALLRATLAQRGIRFCMPAAASRLLGAERVSGVELNDGAVIDADLVVLAIGVRPNIELARSSGLRCDRGVLVDDTMQTYDPSIYAVGECVQHRDTTYGLVAPLWEQARVCAIHLAEYGALRYRGSVLSTQLKVSGVDVYSAGDFVEGPDGESLVYCDARRGVYKRIVLERGRVRGAVLYGDVNDAPRLYDLMRSGRDVSAMREALVFGDTES